MGLLDFFHRQEQRADVSDSDTKESASSGADLLRALMGDDSLTKETVLEIPSANASVSVISNTIMSLPVKLYQETREEVKEIKGDRRTFLLNHDTGDTLTATQFWKSVIEDYFLGKGAYVYINKNATEWESLHYIENAYISIMKNTDPIFKDFDVLVNGKTYSRYDFLKILRHTQDGYTNRPVQDEIKTILSASYNYGKYENNLVKKGGNKKGFLKSENKLDEQAKEKLREAFRNLYRNDTENVVVLNKGLDFKESSNSCVEMQLNENKETNTVEISMVFGVPSNVIRGNATQQDVDNYINYCIVPLLTDIEASLDRDLLTEEEKEQGYYFAFDTKELTRGNIKDRYAAYEIAYRNNFMQVDEIREKEDMKPIGFDFIKLGLDSVLYNPKTGTVYTPNTNETKNIQELEKGSEADESGIKS